MTRSRSTMPPPAPNAVPAIPTPEELAKRTREQDAKVIAETVRHIVSELKWPPDYGDALTISVPRGLSNRVRLHVEALFREKGWLLKHRDSQTDGEFWEVRTPTPND